MAEPIANLNAEQATLGTMLMFPAAAALAPTLTPADFAFTEHAEIFCAIASTVADGQTPHFHLLAPHFAGMKIREFSGPQYLTHLATRHSLPAQEIDGLIAELRSYAGRRTLKALGEYLSATAEDPSAPVSALCSEAIETIDGIASTLRAQRCTSFDIGAIASANMKQLKAGKKPDAIKTGLLDLDRVLGGWHRGELAIIGGRPSMGKSCLIFSTCRQAAKAGTCSLLFSLEMRRETVVYRMLSDAIWNSETPIPYERIIRQEHLTEWEIERIEAAAAAFGELPIRIDDQPGLTIAEICSRARRYADELTRTGGRLDVIAIDHLGKITASDRYAGNAVREIGEKTNALFNLGRELDVAMVVAAQLNRGNEKRENKRAEMSDVRDSGDIEQDADTMLFPYRAAYYLETQKEDDHDRDMERLRKLELCRNTIEINVVKNRNGPRMNVEFFCEIGSNVVRDMAR